MTVYCTYYAFDAVFTAEEITNLNEETHRLLWERYQKIAIERSLASGIKIQSFRGQDVNGVYVIGIETIRDQVPSINSFRTAEEAVLADGYLYRVIKALNAHSYASEKDGFSIHVAAYEAKQAGKRFVVVEDLS